MYANPILRQEIASALYEKSELNYDAQLDNLKKTYGGCLKLAKPFVLKKGRLLDVGTGNGFFLDEALRQGYSEVVGVEPSQHAVSKASDSVRSCIIPDILKANQFESDSFDVVTLFHVVDHVIDPKSVLKICHKILKDSGVLIIVSHDVCALSAKIMGERSPIFDIEHTQLFSLSTISSLVNSVGFNPVVSNSLRNIYSMDYWLTFLPIPAALKHGIRKILDSLGMLHRNLSLKAGNFLLIAVKN